MVTGGLLSGAGVPYLAVGRRGGLRVQLPAAGKGEREREERGEDKQAVRVSPSASTPGQVGERGTHPQEVRGLAGAGALHPGKERPDQVRRGPGW